MSPFMSEFVKIIIVAEVCFAISVSLITPFLPKILQKLEARNSEESVL